jgi:transcriptional regulator with XRE-family HTH domain
MRTIGERIKEIRKSNTLTQSEFAEKVCVSRPHITNIENNKENPSSMLIRLISLLFSISEDWIINGE